MAHKSDYMHMSCQEKREKLILFVKCLKKIFCKLHNNDQDIFQVQLILFSVLVKNRDRSYNTLIRTSAKKVLGGNHVSPPHVQDVPIVLQGLESNMKEEN